ncbi:ribose-phosphate diphosphokinase [Rheinheimera nanhaiensis]|uniref:Ribose-phosphate pyrophosphokinase n=1 Tax=Rheinheimera nanhaiensis E407-8 TaxID=562729 RepID=I1DW59_9GAMM|nr:ribose-phosphate diphosphokinase [Rheinheimera nanhaiensis]GAB58287.1 ribose-phosphate pyrophosphokinase [Rheinheimera nanhaiensis E407-8]
MSVMLLASADEQVGARRLADAAGLPLSLYQQHRFPDQELKLTLPFSATVPTQLVLYRSLNDPNEKLIELLLIARHARALSINKIWLVAPYLAYMRQDIAFNPGEIVSQKIIGRFLAELFDGVLTVDPHLHRINHLSEAIVSGVAIALSGAPRLAELIARECQQPLLIGPDAESEQWVALAGAQIGCDYAVCTKVRSGDKQVHIQLPDVSVGGKNVVLMDDVASSGHTLAEAAKLLLGAGAASVDVAVTHALFAGDALALIKHAGVNRIWSTDCIAHPSNAISMAPVLAKALKPLL